VATEVLPRMRVRTDSAHAAPRPRRVARPLLWLIFAGSSVASLIALAGAWHWFAELFTHFRLYYLLAQGLLIIAFLNTKRYGWLVVTALLALPNAWYVGPYLLPVLTGEAARVSSRPQLISLNLDYRNDDVESVVGYLRRTQPDIVVMSEYTAAWHAALAPVMAAWPHRVMRSREDPFGLAVYSRVPFQDVEWLDLGTPGSENVRVRLSLAGRDIELHAVHLYPPRSADWAAKRNRQLDALGRVASASPRKRIVTGDLNLTPFSPHFSGLLRASGLLDARRAQGLQVTWPAAPVPVWIPIDHALADSSAGVLDVRTGPDIGSDHFPLEITLATAD